MGSMGMSLRYSLDIRCFLRGEGQDPPENNATHATEVETSQNASSSDVTPLTLSSLLTTLDARWVPGASSATVEETFPNTLSSNATPPTTSLPPAVPDAGQVAWDAPEEAALSAFTFEASYKDKGKVNDSEFALFDFSTVVCKDLV